MRVLEDFELKEKKVIIRADFNTPIDEGEIKNCFRLEAVLPTLRYLISKKAKIILIAHLGRPNLNFNGELELREKNEFTMRPLALKLSDLLGQEVFFAKDCIGEIAEKEIDKLRPGQVILMENLRFYKGETENSLDFAKSLAKLGDIYINEAFGVSHRKHASIVGVPKFLPSGAGFFFDKEISNLSMILKEPKHPLSVIIGGVKISTKIKVIRKFLSKADNIALGGALANTVISAKGFAIGKSISEEDMISEVQNLNLTDTALHIPVDVVVSSDSSGDKEINVAPVGKTKEEDMILDIGPDTRNLFKEIIFQSKTIIWNGPMGLWEVEEFAEGTKEIARYISQADAFTVVGGGSSVSALEKLNLMDKINHVSTGGGALLEFLSEESLPGIEALNE